MADESPACTRNYAEVLIIELEKRMDQRFELERIQRDQLQKMLDSRLFEMNEFRTQIQSERADLVRRDTNDVALHALQEGLARLERWQYWVMGGVAVMVIISKMLGWIK